jgi:hypothetical protein
MPAPQVEKARQETGGPTGREDRAGGDIDAQITELEALTTADLRVEWRKLYQAAPPTRLSRDLLTRGVTYKIQEQAYGGLSLSTKRKLRSLTEDSDRRGRSPAAPAIVLKPGAKLVSRMARARAYRQRSGGRVRVSG